MIENFTSWNLLVDAGIISLLMLAGKLMRVAAGLLVITVVNSKGRYIKWYIKKKEK